MSTIVADYDLKKGRKHAFVPIHGWLKKHAPNEEILRQQIAIWARMLTFDALIGNTDRHHDNWGTMWLDQNQFAFAPAFDNGTSLGHELTESRIQSFLKNRHELDAYILRGTHHLRWRETDEKRMRHADLLRAVLDLGSGISLFVKPLLMFSDEDLVREVESVQKIDCPIRLSNLRADFMITLTLRRRELLLESLGLVQ